MGEKLCSCYKIHCSWTFITLFEVKGHLLPFTEGVVCTVTGGGMEEKIFAVFGSDKAKSLGSHHFFYSACRHKKMLKKIKADTC